MKWAVAAAILAVAVLAVRSAGQPAATSEEPPASTVAVQRGDLSAMVSLHGTLTHRARPDGSPYVAINRARGIYTALPAAGDEIACGRVLYRVDDDPVLLLCGRIPAYRSLSAGDEGDDVRRLNRNLGVAGDVFTRETEQALRRRTGADADGSLALGDAVFLPRAVRVAKVAAELGATARPGEQVLQATSGTLEVQVELKASQQREVRAGDRARITLPGHAPVKGRVDRIGRVAETAEEGDIANATIPASIRLRAPKAARGLDKAPVRVEITTKGVDDVLSVPVTALVGKAGGGYAVEVVRDGGRRELVAVEPGLYDTAGGRVQVEGALAEGDRVVVPSL